MHAGRYRLLCLLGSLLCKIVPGVLGAVYSGARRADYRQRYPHQRTEKCDQNRHLRSACFLFFLSLRRFGFLKGRDDRTARCSLISTNIWAPGQKIYTFFKILFRETVRPAERQLRLRPAKARAAP